MLVAWERNGQDGHGRLRLGRAGGLVAIAVAVASVTALPAGAATRTGAGARTAAVRLVQPTPGDWEGSGPHGLRMSFELIGRGHAARVPYAAVSLPDGCRSSPEGGFDTVNLTKVTYYPPGRHPELLFGGAFTVKPAGDFAIVGTDVDVPKYPVVITGRFRSARAGGASAPAYGFRCPRGTGWSKVSRFALTRGRRPLVPDGAYSGPVTGPESGITGTVAARLVGGGRVLTDLAVSYRCPGDTGPSSFELGPSRAAGEFVGPDGRVQEHWTPVGTWSGRFVGDRLTGTFTDQLPDCTDNVATAFTATLG